MPSGKLMKGSKEENVAPDERPEESDETAASDVEETVEETAAASGEEESFRAPEFRPSYVDEERAVGEAAPAPGGDAFFVSVNGSDGAAIHRFDDPAKAKAFVERLLDEGVAEGDVMAFSARRLTLHVRHRPVVTLLTGDE